jgi:methylthioribulose-1-phosphate dehydratase
MGREREEFVETIVRLGARGWCPATSGNFSLRLDRAVGEPARVLMTPSGIDKSRVVERELIEVSLGAGDGDGGVGGRVLAGTGKVSAEFALHEAIYALTQAQAVLHVHSVANTIVSAWHVGAGELRLEGLELLKALAGVSTHEHVERVPVFANTQDMTLLAGLVRERLTREPGCHGFLLGGHGLYTWGRSLDEAARHVEAFEFMFEVVLRRGRGANPSAT